MEEPAKPTTARPRHTTVTAGLIIGGSTLAVLGVVDRAEDGLALRIG